jgi:hypothetical protein
MTNAAADCNHDRDLNQMPVAILVLTAAALIASVEILTGNMVGFAAVVVVVYIVPASLTLLAMKG